MRIEYTTSEVKLGDRYWSLGTKIGSGGFGIVLEATSEGMGQCVAKFIPKDPGAEREMLFVDLVGARNVVPVIDSGEVDDQWILIMPRAERSLRDRLKAGEMNEDEVVAAIKDAADALVDLKGRQVVHRDIKPENTLLLDGHWCLGDFGISRYAEATTETGTRKHAFTAAYAAPERWRDERATDATDVYSLGVMSYEMLSGTLPFTGSREELRNGHLHQPVPSLYGVTPNLSALVVECMAKPPGARPSANAIAERLRAFKVEVSGEVRGGLTKLRESNLEEVVSQRKAESEAFAARSAAEQRKELYQTGEMMLENMSMKLYETILSSASAAEATRPAVGWTIKLGKASLSVGTAAATSPNPWLWEEPVFDVVAHTKISINIPVRNNYQGRSHSLWFCDALEEGQYQWFETSFMVTPIIPQRGLINPFALDPGEEAAQALWKGVGSHQVAWPFEPLHASSLDSFIDRWASWLADAASGRLKHPSQMPERSTKNSWRS